MLENFYKGPCLVSFTLAKSKKLLSMPQLELAHLGSPTVAHFSGRPSYGEMKLSEVIEKILEHVSSSGAKRKKTTTVVCVF